MTDLGQFTALRYVGMLPRYNRWFETVIREQSVKERFNKAHQHIFSVGLFSQIISSQPYMYHEDEFHKQQLDKDGTPICLKIDTAFMRHFYYAIFALRLLEQFSFEISKCCLSLQLNKGIKELSLRLRNSSAENLNMTCTCWCRPITHRKCIQC